MSYSNNSYSSHAASSRFHHASNPPQPPLTTSPNFDILDWHPAYESCQRYFLDHAQHEAGTQALCALINIRLPFQWLTNPIHSSTQPPQSSNPNTAPYNSGRWSRPSASQHSTPVFTSLVPYIRRLVITGFDKPGILHGFFGDAYQAGVTPLQDCERRNYLFAAKHGGWRTCKRQYDMNSEETVPFLKPLQNVQAEELEAAEKSWSSWLAMEDWLLGPREPAESENGDGGMHRDREPAGHSWANHGFAFESNLPDGAPDQLNR